MIDYLKFKNLNDIELTELTENTIIIFKDRESLFCFRKEFENLLEDINYKDIAIKGIDRASSIIELQISCKDITAIYNINNTQRIILTVEPISSLLMKDVNDLWFIDKSENNIWDCWDFSRYENFKNYTTTLDIYKFICVSQYGCCSNTSNKTNNCKQ